MHALRERATDPHKRWKAAPNGKSQHTGYQIPEIAREYPEEPRLCLRAQEKAAHYSVAISPPRSVVFPRPSTCALCLQASGGFASLSLFPPNPPCSYPLRPSHPPHSSISFSLLLSLIVISPPSILPLPFPLTSPLCLFSPWITIPVPIVVLPFFPYFSPFLVVARRSSPSEEKHLAILPCP